MTEACCHSKKPWYKEKLFIITIITIVLLIVAYNIVFLRPFFDAFVDYFKLIWWAVLLGLLIGGLIDYYVPSSYISKYLAQSKKRTILYATGLGFLMSGCSHGILAIAIQLYKKGASIPAVISFLLAAPWSNLTMTIILFGFFGVKALFIVISAIVIAIITGWVYQLLDKKKLIEQPKKIKIKDGFSIRQDMKKRFKNYQFSWFNFRKDTTGVLRGSWSLSEMVLWWLIVGVLLAAAANAFVPTHIFHKYLGPSLLGLFITLIFATIIEVCSEGASPLSFEIFRQTGAFGNSFVFLNAGVATDYTEIGLLWTNIGKKTALWLPVITAPQIVVLGYLFNVLL